jgi:tyrosine-specific transport protein
MNVKLWKSMFLVVGTAIGAGILALPITTASSGFFGSTLSLLICWAFMTNAAYYMLKVRLCFKGEADLTKMTTTMLGQGGKYFTEVSYLLLLFALVSVYIIVGSAWTEGLLETVVPWNLPSSTVQYGFTIVIALLIFSGIGCLSFVNIFVASGMLAALMFIILLSMPDVEVKNLQPVNFSEIPWTFPMILTTLGFSIILPSITPYMGDNKRQLLKVITGGSLIILVTYLLWEMVSFGVLGSGLFGLTGVQDKGTEVVYALSQVVSAPLFAKAGFSFMFLATLSSLLGVGQCLYSYLRDTIPLRHKGGVLYFQFL